MPELPEVETVRRDLEPRLRGRRVVNVAVTHVRSVRRQPHADFVFALRGRTITSVRRHGKFLFAELDGSDALVAHLRMSGQLRIASRGDELIKHTHVVISLDNGEELRFVDPRTFGEMFVDKLDDDRPVALRDLGPDAMDPRLSARALHHRLTAGRRVSTIKAALLDQRALAGVGNIYADEVLFASGLHPKRPAAFLGLDEAKVLRSQLRRILKAAISARGTSFKDEGYVDAYGQLGGYSARHKVYGRDGQPCPRCGTPIEKSVIAQRGTHFCPTCQSIREVPESSR
ncbi:MAG: formamidopyrimidine-DNA glycosylase [Actinomycetota bacterium]